MSRLRQTGLAFNLALRELRGGLKGFYVFLACLALGVAAIAGVGSLSRALSQSLAVQGQVILGGDVALTLLHRQANADERAYLTGAGRLSEIATLRAMARREDLTDQTLVEIKAVDAAYPLYGAMTLAAGGTPADALARRDATWGAIVEPALLQRLGARVGDRLRLGDLLLEVRDTIVAEPDRLSSGLTFGPRLMIAAAALAKSGLVRPGSLIHWRYRVALSQGAAEAADLVRFERRTNTALPDAGWEIRNRTKAAPRLQIAVDRFAQILTLVGLTALIVGGVGVANAVRGHLDAKRETIAILKCLGAPAGTIFAVYLIEIGLIALAGIALGIAAGALAPPVAANLLAGVLPLRIESGLYPGPLAMAAAYGFLTALAFSLWPLGQARDVPAAVLFRGLVERARTRPRARYILAATACLAALAGLAVLSAQDRRIALIYVAVAAGAIVLLRCVGWGVMVLARRAPLLGWPEARLAIGNIHRPGALTPSVVLSLGLGLALLVALALIDRNLTRELSTSIPEQAPSFFFVDIQRGEADAFAAMIQKMAPRGEMDSVPMLRGRFVTLGGVRVEDIDAPPDKRWALNGDRGVTYSQTPPEGSRLVAGTWWPKDYAGEPLVSFEAELAAAFGLKLGDKITVNVLGRPIEARIASLRAVDWGSLGINFVMVFSPNTFAGAPHMVLTTLTLPGQADSDREVAILNAVSKTYPQVTIVRVKEALATARALLEDIMWAIRGASGVTIVASVLVLAGALAAGHRGRVYDAVILKTLGATRRRLLLAYGLEYVLLGLATALFAVIAGSIAAYIVLTQVMRASFIFAPEVALGTALGAMLVMILLGLAASFRLLGLKPARVLRSL